MNKREFSQEEKLKIVDTYLKDGETVFSVSQKFRTRNRTIVCILTEASVSIDQTKNMRSRIVDGKKECSSCHQRLPQT